MDPLTLMLLGGGIELVSGLIGTGLSMDSARRETEANAAELERSANLEVLKGLDALKQGQTAVGRQRMKTSAYRSSQAVGYARAGVDSSVGTPADVGLATERIGELDASTLENNAVRAAFGFKQSARAMRRQADSVRAQGAAANTKGLLSGIGQVSQAGQRAFSVYSDSKKGG